jgi:hypothetical protein
MGGSFDPSGFVDDGENNSMYSGVRSHKRIGTRGNGVNGASIPSKVVSSQLRALRVPVSPSQIYRDKSPQGSVASSLLCFPVMKSMSLCIDSACNIVRPLNE